eukprot:16449947-Heterocapsa_arctica.AAC.1
MAIHPGSVRGPFASNTHMGKMAPGRTGSVNRGAGQGEPDGPLKTAVVLGNDINQTHEDTRVNNTGKWADAWFIDDG